jgi:hypothetical protein
MGTAGEAAPGSGAGPAEAPASIATESSDPRAVALAARLVAALGGERAWEAAHCFYFTFAEGDATGERMRRTHYWDRRSGRHRVEGTDRRGRKFVVIQTLGDSTGALATLDGAAVPDSAAVHGLREGAYAWWASDSYWLLAPFKLRDPGVRLDYDGTESEGEHHWDVIRVSFDRVGPTPGDRYWLYLDRETGLLERWAFVREDVPPGSQPIPYDWTDWRRFGGILLAEKRQAVGSARMIFFPELAVLDAFPAAVFSSPEPVVMPAL